MKRDHHEVQLIAITLADGSLAVMQFITRAWNSKYVRASSGPIMGMLEGASFTVEEPQPSPDDTLVYSREATDEAIEAEIGKSAFGQPVKSWRRISPDDLPATRENREAWRDDGVKIAVNPAAIKIPPRNTLAELDALKAENAALRARLDKLDGGGVTTTR